MHTWCLCRGICAGDRGGSAHRADDAVGILAAVARDLGVTVRLVEQRLIEALDIADRAYVLQADRTVLF
jgi:ABC-type branched-subunit amino acid transport system ATPase component